MAQKTGICFRKPYVMAIALCFLLLLPARGAFAARGPFEELPAGHWSYHAIERLSNLGLITSDLTGFGELYIVSRCEMAAWVLEALERIDAAVDVAPLATKGNLRMWDLEQLLSMYGVSATAARFTSDDIQLLYDLVNLVRPELQMLGQAFVTPQGGALTMALMGISKEMAIDDKGQKADDALAAFMPMSTIHSDGVEAEFGLAMSVGDVKLLASQSQLAQKGAGGTVTSVGLGLWLPNLQVKVNYAMQTVGNSEVSSTGTQRHTASAGLGYQLTPASEAAAGITISGEPGQKTTADFGLRYTVNGASVSVGYSVSSPVLAEDENLQEHTTNIAAAEFTIRF